MAQEMTGNQVENWSLCQSASPAVCNNNVAQETNCFQLNASIQQPTIDKMMSQQQLIIAHYQPLSQFAADHLIKPMHAFESKLNYFFYDIWQETGDERTNKLPFIGAGPWKLLYATLVYLYLIKWLLPRLMRSKRPFELNWIIRVYNLLMVLSNIWAFYHGTRILSFGLKCFGCETIDHKDYSPSAIELLHYGWLFFLSRLIEWLDTIFFVLRKKDKQVTKLHVFHHSFVPLISWTYLKYHPGYTVAFFPFVNSFVHSIMYTYYFLATFGVKLQPYLWWKRYLTSLQIAQFVLILIQLASIPLTGNDTCQYPRGFLYVAFAGAILFLWLFYTYYVDTYTKGCAEMATTITTTVKANSQRRDSAISLTEPSAIARDATQQRQKPRRTSMRETMHNTMGQHQFCNQREGSSKALADAIENAIGSFCDLAVEQAASRTTMDSNRKFVWWWLA